MPKTQVSSVKLACGNCIDILKSIPDGTIDLILTDPPYGLDFDYKSYNDTEENWIRLMDGFIPEAKRVAKMVIMPACQINKLEWIYSNYPPDWLICWFKGSPGHSAYIGFNDWEPHLVYGKTKSNLYMHDHFQTRASPKKGWFNHPCPKPIDWALWLIQKATDEGMSVLDPFMGSGTTGVACMKLNRDFMGIELEKDYYQTAKSRIKYAQKNPTALDLKSKPKGMGLWGILGDDNA